MVASCRDGRSSHVRRVNVHEERQANMHVKTAILMSAFVVFFLHVGICVAFAPPASRLARVKAPRYEPHGIQVFATGNKDNSDEPAGGSNPASQLVKSWLMTHLPTLSSSDLQLYSTCLLNDGHCTTDQLNKLNSGGQSGRVEDLYFMKKGHRRLLMKKIGLINGLKNSGANRLYDEGNLSSNERSTEMRPTSTDDEFLPEKFQAVVWWIVQTVYRYSRGYTKNYLHMYRDSTFHRLAVYKMPQRN